jgi:hypothetical protein
MTCPACNGCEVPICAACSGGYSEEVDYFAVRPACGCVTAWLSATSTEDERGRFFRRMLVIGRDVIRGSLDEYRDRIGQCPHQGAINEPCNQKEEVPMPGESNDASDGLLRVWECAHVLRLPGGNPDFKRCGFIARGPGICPYDHHGADVSLVEIKALVLCSDCAIAISRDDARAPDGRLICGECAMGYVGRHGSEESPAILRSRRG